MALMRTKLALSTLCENPRRRTGLSTLFPEFITHARRVFPEVSWLVFADRESSWDDGDAEVEVCRDFPANDRRLPRLIADHLRVAPAARDRGAAALLTVGFYPLRPAALPVAMQVFAVDHLQGKGLRAGYRRWAVARGLRLASLVITNSSWAATQLGATSAPVMVSPEGIRHDRFQPGGPAGWPGIPGRYLLWASNLYAYKRIELALQAYAGLGAERRREFPLVVVGGDWEGGRARAEAVAGRLGIAGDVRFLGWVGDDDLPRLYRGAQAHLLSTEHETFGRSVLESMACGCPSVLQDLPVLREVAAECALYVDFRDTVAATAALERILTSGPAREALATAGVARARIYSFERLARERVGGLLQMLERLRA
jgi:glycosyltransferase involved in cell wall biosynthesis